MKRDRQSKGESLLITAERSLRESLLDFLPRAAISGSPIFTNSKFNPHRLPEHHVLAEAETFLDAASACVELRQRLMLPVAGSIGQLHISACEESASSNEQRRGLRKLAADLLKLLREEP
jgi:hypothetical protein